MIVRLITSYLHLVNVAHSKNVVPASKIVALVPNHASNILRVYEMMSRYLFIGCS